MGSSLDNIFSAQIVKDAIEFIQRKKVEFVGSAVSIADDPVQKKTIITIDSGAAAHASRHVRGAAYEIDGDKLDVDFAPSNYNRATVDGLTTNLQELASHLNGIDSSIGTARASQGMFFEFQHIGQNNVGTTRRMWPSGSFNTTVYTVQRMTWCQRVIPYAGKLKRIVSRNPAASAGTSVTTAYTVLKSTDNGATWNATALATSTTAGDQSVQTYSEDVSVAAGDMICVEVTFSGLVTQDPSNSCMYAGVWFAKD